MKLQFPTLSNVSNSLPTPSDRFLIKNRARWEEQKTLETATELYSSLLVREMLNDFHAKETLTYLLSQNIPLPRGVAAILSPELQKVDKNTNYSTNIQELYLIIHRLKSILKKFPNDAMTWNDLAFYYATLGEDEKAGKAMTTAFHLSKGNAFIVRSYSRYLVHKQEFDKALWLLKKSSMIKFNPLVASAFLSISELAGKKAERSINGKRIFDSYEGEPAFSSDLAASIGTLEFKNGSVKKAKHYFNLAMRAPSENTLSQYQWLHHKTGFTLSNSINSDLSSIEGSVHELYINGNFKECRNRLVELFTFQPFSDGPIADAGYMSLVGLNDPQFVVDISKNRLDNITHMGFGELNNLIVANLMLDNLNDVELHIRLLYKKVNPENKGSLGIFYATYGLLLFKLKKIESGKEQYEKAIEYFKKSNNHYSVALAEHYY